MMLTTQLMEELQVGDFVTFCFDELDTQRYTSLQLDYPGVWVFDGYSKCPVSCNVKYCKGKMKFSNGNKKLFRCMVHNVAGGSGGHVSPISILSNFHLDETLFEI